MLRPGRTDKCEKLAVAPLVARSARQHSAVGSHVLWQLPAVDCGHSSPRVTMQITEQTARRSKRQVSIYLLSCRLLEPRLDKHLTFSRIPDWLYVRCELYLLYVRCETYLLYVRCEMYLMYVWCEMYLLYVRCICCMWDVRCICCMWDVSAVCEMYLLYVRCICCMWDVSAVCELYLLYVSCICFSLFINFAYNFCVSCALALFIYFRLDRRICCA